MRALFIWLFAVVGASGAGAQERPSEFKALGVLPKEEALHLARIVGREGTPNPERWYFIIHSPSAPGGVREFVVEGQEIVASRELSQFADHLDAEEVMPGGSLKVDSEAAARMVSEFAVANGLDISGFNYELANNGPKTAPVWKVTCLDPSGKAVGQLMVTAALGTVVYHEGFAKEPARAMVASEKPSRRRRAEPTGFASRAGAAEPQAEPPNERRPEAARGSARRRALSAPAVFSAPVRCAGAAPIDIGECGVLGVVGASRLMLNAGFPRMNLAVLNPGGNDPQQEFPEFAGKPDSAGHAPVNFHGFAACTGGGFYRKDNALGPGKAVLLLIRHDLKAVRQAAVELRRAGKVVAISFKEAGAFQIASLLNHPGRVRLLHEICQRVHGAIATTEDAVPYLRAFGAHTVEWIPTPYPVESAGWDFSVPLDERRGIMIGTREFKMPSRNHLAALMAAIQLGGSMQEPVTVFNVEGWGGRRMLASLRVPEGLLHVVEGRLPYAKYLRLMAGHKLVLQFDASSVPGQVAGDALLCRIPCVGGNGTTERLVYPDLCGHGRSHEELGHLAARLLEHPHDCQAVTERAVTLGIEEIGFPAVAGKLERFFRGLGAAQTS